MCLRVTRFTIPQFPYTPYFSVPFCTKLEDLLLDWGHSTRLGSLLCPIMTKGTGGQNPDLKKVHYKNIH